MKIAIIGAGNMGGSIARGLAKGSLIADSDIIVSNPSAGKLASPQLRITRKLLQEQILSFWRSSHGSWNR